MTKAISEIALKMKQTRLDKEILKLKLKQEVKKSIV